MDPINASQKHYKNEDLNNIMIFEDIDIKTYTRNTSNLILPIAM